MWQTNCQWWRGPGFFFPAPLGMLIGFLFWVALVYGVVHLITRLTKNRVETENGETTPMDILKKRYASGKIDKEEFLEKKREMEP